MTRILRIGCLAVGLSFAGAAAALNPQPLPPRCVAGVKCGGSAGGAHSREIAMVHESHCKIVHHHRVCRK
jgi:hypothetical protein